MFIFLKDPTHNHVGKNRFQYGKCEPPTLSQMAAYRNLVRTMHVWVKCLEHERKVVAFLYDRFQTDVTTGIVRHVRREMRTLMAVSYCIVASCSI